MFHAIENFFLNKVAGQVIAKIGLTAAAYVAAPGLQGALLAHGVSVSVDPTAFSAGIMALFHSALVWYENWRVNSSPVAAANAATAAQTAVDKAGPPLPPK